MWEVFVYSPRVEAVHLRGGKVARGGIRWSDRREDFRTEILGLVKAQMVKNAVIVPVGAKGGFVLKRPPAEGGREALQAEGIECYKTLIRGLLDLTDNLQGDQVIPPTDVVRRDGNDPYLVVAADKGTATFSDIANGVSAEYGFWLGDAFASGGSAGYDHKKMAITARGAWESVKQHFRAFDRNIQEQDFTVVGVGDMSGDVFGNGMLLSKHIRLVGAFDHRHIFVDPNPDPAISWAERQRLFDLPRSSWKDYDPSLLSAGGGIFERSAKSIVVSREVQQLLELSSPEITPTRLMRALLRAPVDLLWFGGIGTYVKASQESHGRVGDRANNEIRVDATELRAKVVGEGANLGLTQAARIEYARAGGRLNTDFIDNSGGVDCSDHEVNIKIALSGVVARGEMTLEERDRLLSEMTDQVGQLVLRDNYLQSQAITLTESQGATLLSEQAQLMRELERNPVRLDRKLENLPNEDVLAERRAAKKGLTRPEIAVLLAYSKIHVYGELLDSKLPDDPQLASDLVRYFPPPMHERLLDAIEHHRLRREIIATHVTNSMVNRVGPNFVVRMAEETGATVSEIARAYTAARDVFELRQVWEGIEALDNKVQMKLQVEMYLESVRLIEATTRWFLRHGQRPLDIAATVARFRTPRPRSRCTSTTCSHRSCGPICAGAPTACTKKRFPSGSRGGSRGSPSCPRRATFRAAPRPRGSTSKRWARSTSRSASVLVSIGCAEVRRSSRATTRGTRTRLPPRSRSSSGTRPT
ncbi:MAG: NAD-glutamate dehydrogenase [Thermoanaerobaculia bacterium]|nr:NAD-glutamate dehydrogenase [Thermoanaerobaculia bacterium]